MNTRISAIIAMSIFTILILSLALIGRESEVVLESSASSSNTYSDTQLTSNSTSTIKDEAIDVENLGELEDAFTRLRDQPNSLSENLNYSSAEISELTQIRDRQLAEYENIVYSTYSDFFGELGVDEVQKANILEELVISHTKQRDILMSFHAGLISREKFEQAASMLSPVSLVQGYLDQDEYLEYLQWEVARN